MSYLQNTRLDTHSQKLRESSNAWAKVREDPVKPAFHAANLAFQVWHSVCIDAAHPS